MRILKLLLLSLLFVGTVYANKTITVTLTDEEYKVLEWQLISPEQWVENAVRGKINKSKGRMLLELTDKRIEKLTKQEEKDLIKNSTLKTRVERDLEEVVTP